MEKKVIIVAFILCSLGLGYAKGEISFEKQQKIEKEEQIKEVVIISEPKLANNSEIELRNKIVKFAKTQLGKPYLWGASGNNQFDCSSFTQYVLQKTAGITIPRVSYHQASFRSKMSKGIKKGDLLFFETLGKGRISHVGIYIGNREFIHASSKYGKVIISEFKGYYEKSFRWAISVI